MPGNDKFFSVNIREYLALGNDEEAGEPALVELLSGFSSPKNKDVERFLKKSAIEFTKKNQSVTYLVVSAEDVRLLGYFTLALKPLTVRGETVSNTMKRKLLRISELDEKSSKKDADKIIFYCFPVGPQNILPTIIHRDTL